VNPPDRGTTSSAVADERTDLAWNRSGLALLACGLVVGRGLSLSGLPAPRAAAGAVILGLGALTYLLAAWHAQRRLRPGRTEVPATSADLLPVAIGIAAVGVAAFVLGALFPA
jgi:inner membrane protein YidH